MIVDKKKFAHALIDADMTNKALSEAPGVSIARISFIKNGKGTTYETLKKISDALGVSIFDLMIEEEKK